MQGPSGKTQASEAVLRAIYGPKSTEKSDEYDKSLHNWWKEYAARKNDEEEEHVADSLMYDERTTLPRMAQRPDIIDDKSAAEHMHALQLQQQQQREMLTAAKQGVVNLMRPVVNRKQNDDQQ